MIEYKDLAPITLSAEIPGEARSWRNDALIREWTREFTLITEIEQEIWQRYVQDSSHVKMFGITNLTHFVGVCGLTSIDRTNQNAEFSLYIAPHYQKKGYGKKALISLLRHGFDCLNLIRIWGETFDHNPAIDMFLEMGMVQEGTLRNSYFRDGKFIDSHMVAVLRDEFRYKHRVVELKVL